MPDVSSATDAATDPGAVVDAGGADLMGAADATGDGGDAGGSGPTAPANCGAGWQRVIQPMAGQDKPTAWSVLVVPQAPPLPVVTFVSFGQPGSTWWHVGYVNQAGNPTAQPGNALAELGQVLDAVADGKQIRVLLHRLNKLVVVTWTWQQVPEYAEQEQTIDGMVPNCTVVTGKLDVDGAGGWTAAVQCDDQVALARPTQPLGPWLGEVKPLVKVVSQRPRSQPVFVHTDAGGLWLVHSTRSGLNVRVLNPTTLAVKEAWMAGTNAEPLDSAEATRHATVAALAAGPRLALQTPWLHIGSGAAALELLTGKLNWPEFGKGVTLQSDSVEAHGHWASGQFAWAQIAPEGLQVGWTHDDGTFAGSAHLHTLGHYDAVDAAFVHPDAPDGCVWVASVQRWYQQVLVAVQPVCLHGPPKPNVDQLTWQPADLCAPPPAMTCTAKQVWAEDKKLAAATVGRAFAMPQPSNDYGGAWGCLTYVMPDGQWRGRCDRTDTQGSYAHQQSLQTTDGQWLDVRLLDGALYDAKSGGGSAVALRVDPKGKLHATLYEGAYLGKSGYTPPDVLVQGEMAACSNLSGSLRWHPQGTTTMASRTFDIAVAGTTCAGKPWLGVGRVDLMGYDNAKLTALPLTPELYPVPAGSSLVAMAVPLDALAGGGNQPATVLAQPIFAGGALGPGIPVGVYAFGLGDTVSPLEVWGLALAKPGDLALPLASRTGALAVLAATNESGEVKDTLHVGTELSEPPFAGLFAKTVSPQTLPATALASLDAAPLWDVDSHWRGAAGEDLVVTSVSVGTPTASGINLQWFDRYGLLRGVAQGAQALAHGTTFGSAALTPMRAGAVDGCFLLYGSVANAGQPWSLRAYEVCCAP